MGPIDWQVTARDGNARAGILTTRRSVIETPVFMPVGTQATVKGVRFEWLEKELDARVILGNTYHLFLRPGPEIIRHLGGLHKFSTWDRSLLTDSGGFQVFSLAALRKLNEDGVEFRSHIDGSLKFLSPEVSMEVQAALGSDIVMAFDECVHGDVGYEETKRSLDLTLRWAARSKNRFRQTQEAGLDAGRIEVASSSSSFPTEKRSETRSLNGEQALFGIVQGAGHPGLRRESLERTVEIGFDGYAVGGLSVGEAKTVMYEVLAGLGPQMPADAPRYLMGVGTPEDLLEAVSHGVDMFDCVLPTRNGRTGSAFTTRGSINIRNARFRTEEAPLDPECRCSVCQRYSRAYLGHLYRAGEMLAATLISHHNLAFFLDTMRRVRQAIGLGSFAEFKKQFLSNLKQESAISRL